MFGYLIHRLLIMIPTLLVISAITFVIIQSGRKGRQSQLDVLRAAGHRSRRSGIHRMIDKQHHGSVDRVAKHRSFTEND